MPQNPISSKHRLCGEDGKALKTSIACVFVASLVGGCNMSDADWLAAKHCGYAASSDTSGMCGNARRQQSRAASDRASDAKYRRRQADNAALNADFNRWQGEIRAKRRADEAARRAAMTPAQKRSERRNLEKQRARERERLKEQNKKRMAYRLKESRGTIEKWDRERRLVRQGNSAIARKYPDLAWLNGIWCWGLDGKEKIRHEVLADGRLRSVFFSRHTATSNAMIFENTNLIRRRAGNYILTSPRSWQRPKQHYEKTIRKENNDQYRSLGTVSVNRWGRRSENKSKFIYKRCDVG